MIVGTAGHIDHGKTLLVKALTGVETDRLKEEKARGITIELGFAYVPVPGTATPERPIGEILGFVDVPGHERFVHTMLAGAASVDFAVLVVAADDGVMPQTREHVQILDLLGIREGLVALNKIDLVDDDRRREVEAQIKGALAGTTLAQADILPVSAATGAGIAHLKQRLMDEAARRPQRAVRGAFRQAVDRSFSVQGAGTVVTGAVQSGRVAVGDKVMTLPGRQELRVRAIHAQGQGAQTGRTGERCAINLAGIERDGVKRGDWLVDPGHASATSRYDADIQLLGTEPRALKTWTPAHLHIGTSQTLARIVLLDDDKLAPGTRALAQIVADDALPLRHGDRFVLRDAAAERTIGGGTVIDPRAPQRKRRTPERRAMLEALREPDAALGLVKLLDLTPGIVDFAAYIVDRGLDAEEAETLIAILEPVVAETSGVRSIARPETVAALGKGVEDILKAFHAAHPELPGMTAEALRLKMTPRLTKPTFAALVAMLAGGGALVAQAGALRLPSHSSSLGAADQKLWERIEKQIVEQKFRPPQVREMAESLGQPIGNIRKLCKTMARIGTLVEVATDRFFLRSALAELGTIAGELAAASAAKSFTAAEFKDRVGCGRNVGIQLLEHFDRRGLTARKGEVRVVVKRPEDVFGAPR